MIFGFWETPLKRKEEKIKYEKDIINIFNGNIPKEFNNDFLLNIIGLYYEIIEKNYDESYRDECLKICGQKIILIE